MVKPMRCVAVYIALLATTCFVAPCFSADPISEWASSSPNDVIKAAQGGNASAQWYLGYCCRFGIKFRPNRATAVAWFCKAAEQNLAEAQCDLGFCYYNGWGVAEDKVEAVKCFFKAAEQNFAKAQTMLGACYLDGEGVAKDEVEAYKWFLLAAWQRDKDANEDIASVKDRLTPEQIAEGTRRAEEWRKRHNSSPAMASQTAGASDADRVAELRAKAENGDALAQFKLGICYANGEVVAKDEAEAVKWFLLAYRTPQVGKDLINSMQVVSTRVDLERRLTPDQIAEAKRRAEEWRKQHKF